jgi:hypothetical protein
MIKKGLIKTKNIVNRVVLVHLKNKKSYKWKKKMKLRLLIFNYLETKRNKKKSVHYHFLTFLPLESSRSVNNN